MFIHVIWKDPAELSTIRRQSSALLLDESTEKSLLVNPECPVRIMLEYIRKKCKLGSFTEFDLCDESGGLLGLFNLPTYMYATDMFAHKRTYYIIVFKMESEKQVTVLPQLNLENPLHEAMYHRVKRYMATGDVTPMSTPQLSAPGTKSLKSVIRKK